MCFSKAASRLHCVVLIVSFSLLITSQPAAAQAPAYEFTVLEARSVPLNQFPILSAATINNAGVVAYMRFDGDAGLVINDGSQEDVTDLTSITGFAAASAKPFINDQGAVGVGWRPGILGNVFRINPDSTVTMLATLDSNGSADFRDISGFAYAMNDSGQIGALVTLNSGDPAIVLLDDSGATVIDESAFPEGRFNFTGAAINDAGIVAYKAQEDAPDGVSVFTGDGISPVQKALPLPPECGNSGAGPDINNNGLVAGQQPLCLAVGAGGAITDLVVDQDANPFAGSVANISFNDADQVVFSLSNNAVGLFFGDDPVNNKLIEEGDMFMGAPVVLVDFGGDGGMNNSGQVVFRVQTLTNDNLPMSYLVRADPPMPRFDDVPPTYWAFSFIETLAASGITSGCGNDDFCPENAVTRAQMAVFLERGVRGSDFSPPAASGTVFLDVKANDFAAGFIEQLFLDGITGGCGSNNYCPGNAVTRAQMAVFLLRAEHGAGYLPPAPAGGVFNDVDLGYWAVAWIEQLAAEGITGGCGDGNFCPDDPVTRAEMAVFLVRTFAL